MFNKKRSFFERLTGIVDDDDAPTNVPLYHSPDPLRLREFENQRMPMKAPSPGGAPMQEPGGNYQYPQYSHPQSRHWSDAIPSGVPQPEPEEEAEGQLAVDVYHTRTEIIFQTMVAGIRPEDLDITITHDRVTVSGRREGPHGVPPEDYMHSELYWGRFSRSVFLPQEIEPEEAEAIEKHGLLILRLPKVDKEREHKLKIKQL